MPGGRHVRGHAFAGACSLHLPFGDGHERILEVELARLEAAHRQVGADQRLEQAGGGLLAPPRGRRRAGRQLDGQPHRGAVDGRSSPAAARAGARPAAAPVEARPAAEELQLEVRMRAAPVNPIAAALLATQLVGEPEIANLVAGLVAVFAGIWIATSEVRKA